MTKKSDYNIKKCLKPLNSSLYNLESSFGKRHQKNLMKFLHPQNDILTVEKFQPTLPIKELSKNPYFFRTVVRERMRAKGGDSKQISQWKPISLEKRLQRAKTRVRRQSVGSRSLSTKQKLLPLGSLGIEMDDMLMIKSRRTFLRDNKNKQELKRSAKINYQSMGTESLYESYKYSIRNEIHDYDF